MSYRGDNSYTSDDEVIVSEYRRSSKEMPSSDLDKLINAAARREASVERKSQQFSRKQLYFWNKLRLPVSFAGAFVMTLTLAHVMWPIISSPEGSLLESEAFTDNSVSKSAESVRDSASSLTEDISLLRQKHSKKALSSANSEQLGNTELQFETDLSAVGLEVLPVDTEQRNAWLNEIIALAESGQFHKMNQELKLFVKRYPDFPVKSHLQPYLQ